MRPLRGVDGFSVYIDLNFDGIERDQWVVLSEGPKLRKSTSLLLAEKLSWTSNKAEYKDRESLDWGRQKFRSLESDQIHSPTSDGSFVRL